VKENKDSDRGGAALFSLKFGKKNGEENKEPLWIRASMAREIAGMSGKRKCKATKSGKKKSQNSKVMGLAIRCHPE